MAINQGCLRESCCIHCPRESGTVISWRWSRIMLHFRAFVYEKSLSVRHLRSALISRSRPVMASLGFWKCVPRDTSDVHLRWLFLYLLRNQGKWVFCKVIFWWIVGIFFVFLFYWNCWWKRCNPLGSEFMKKGRVEMWKSRSHLHLCIYLWEVEIVAN